MYTIYRYSHFDLYEKGFPFATVMRRHRLLATSHTPRNSQLPEEWVLSESRQSRLLVMPAPSGESMYTEMSISVFS